MLQIGSTIAELPGLRRRDLRNSTQIKAQSANGMPAFRDPKDLRQPGCAVPSDHRSLFDEEPAPRR